MAEEESGKIVQQASVGDYTRYVQFLYLAGIGVAAWLLVKTISTMWGVFGEPMDIVVYVLSLGGAVACGLALWRNKRVHDLSYEVVTELSKVTWPTKKELYAAVVAVIIVSIVVSIILFMIDAFWSWATTKLYLL